MVVSMTGYTLPVMFCYYVLFDEKYHHRDPEALLKNNVAHIENTGTVGNARIDENAIQISGKVEMDSGRKKSESEIGN